MSELRQRVHKKLGFDCGVRISQHKQTKLEEVKMPKVEVTCILYFVLKEGLKLDHCEIILGVIVSVSHVYSIGLLIFFNSINGLPNTWKPHNNYCYVIF